MDRNTDIPHVHNSEKWSETTGTLYMLIPYWRPIKSAKKCKTNIHTSDMEYEKGKFALDNQTSVIPDHTGDSKGY